MDKEFDIWKVTEFHGRSIDFNLQLDDRVKEHTKLDIWAHRELMKPKDEWMNKHGIHPIKEGMELYKESMRKALSHLIDSMELPRE
jgi:hypothetical protein